MSEDHILCHCLKQSSQKCLQHPQNKNLNGTRFTAGRHEAEDNTGTQSIPLQHQVWSKNASDTNFWNAPRTRRKRDLVGGELCSVRFATSYPSENPLVAPIFTFDRYLVTFSFLSPSTFFAPSLFFSYFTGYGHNI